MLLDRRSGRNAEGGTGREGVEPVGEHAASTREQGRLGWRTPRATAPGVNVGMLLRSRCRLEADRKDCPDGHGRPVVLEGTIADDSRGFLRGHVEFEDTRREMNASFRNPS